jgi:hypothetical protein
MSLLGTREEIVALIWPQAWQWISENLGGSMTVAGEDAQEAFLRELEDATDAERFEVITEENFDEYRGNFGEPIEIGDPVYFDGVDCLAVTRSGIATWIRQSSDDIAERLKYELVAQSFDRFIGSVGLKSNNEASGPIGERLGRPKVIDASGN